MTISTGSTRGRLRLPVLSVSLLLLATLFVRLFRFPNDGIRTSVFQCSLYALLLLVLFALTASRYRKPFARSLGWIFAPTTWMWVLAGPPLAIAIAAIAAKLHAPANPTIQNLITDRASTLAVVFFGAIAGPAFEETVFRGFLQPLFARHLPRQVRTHVAHHRLVRHALLDVLDLHVRHLGLLHRPHLVAAQVEELAAAARRRHHPRHQRVARRQEPLARLRQRVDVPLRLERHLLDTGCDGDNQLCGTGWHCDLPSQPAEWSG